MKKNELTYQVYDKDIKLKIEISPDNNMEAFGCYLSPSADEGTALIKLNFAAILGCCIEEKLDLYEVLSETTMHEIIHALEDIFKQTFSEEEVSKIIELNTSQVESKE